MAAVAGEGIDGEHTVVGASAAAGGSGGICKGGDLLQRKHGALLSVIALPGQQCRAKGAHDAGNIRTGGFHAGNAFKGTQYRLVIEGSALNHNVGAQFPGIGQLDDLEQSILDDRIGQTGRNIGNGGAFLLCLLHVGVHEYRTAGAKINRMLGKQRLFSKGLRGEAKRVGEVFNKGTAAGGTGLVEQHVFHHAVFQLDAFHVLTADIQHAIHLGVKKGGSGTVGNGLYFALIQAEGRLQQGFAVTGGTGTNDPCPFGHTCLQLRHGVHGRFDGIALIVGIEGMQQLTLAANKGHFCGGGAGVDAQETVTLIGLQIGLCHHGAVVPGAKSVVIGSAGKKRIQTLEFKGHFNAFFQPLLQLGQRYGTLIIDGQSGAHGGKQMGVFGIHRGFGGELQRANKGFFQLGQKVQRTAQKGHTAPDGLAAGQTGDGLLHHCLEDGGGQVGFCGALVDKGLNIGLGKNTAACGDRIDLLIIDRLLVQTGGIGLEQRSHLVNKGTGAAGADTVHTLFQTALEIDDFSVFAAQLNGHIGLRCHMLQGGSNGHNFLHKRNFQSLSQVDRTRAGDPGDEGALAQFQPGIVQKPGKRFLGTSAVPDIFSKKNMVLFIQQHQLDGGGADVNTCAISLHENAS